MQIPPSAFRLLLLIYVVSHFAAPSAGQDLLPPERPIHEAIDHYIDRKLSDEGVTPAPVIEAANFSRRVTLDLAGRIPTAAEVRAFVESPDKDRRVKLIDRLLASPDFFRHQRNEFDRLLSLEGKSDAGFRDYLLKSFRDNRSWDRLFREMIAAPEKEKEPTPELAFVKSRVGDIDRLTTDVSSLFFGVNISCAKCHNHPLVSDWKQDHFFGMKSFFAATYLTKAKRLGERDALQVKFKTTAGETKQARLMFLTGVVVKEPDVKLSKKEKAELKKRLQEADKKKLPPPPPRFSRRAKLVELALKPGQNDFFARSIVNRLWHRLLGHGLVNPLDQMHSENEPTHPHLLDWLARDLVGHGYDLKRLIRGIVLSQTFSRSSRWESGDPPSADLFAVAQVRPLTPRQFALSLILASSAPGSIPTLLTGMKLKVWEKRIEQLENQAQGFAEQIEAPSENFQISVSEALLFSNSSRIQNDYLRDSNDKLVGHLKGVKDHREAIGAAIWNVFSRPPTEEEFKTFYAYLSRREDRRIEGRRQMVWTLLTSSEFRFNY